MAIVKKRKNFFDERFFRLMKDIRRNPNNQQTKIMLNEYVEKFQGICNWPAKSQIEFFKEVWLWYATVEKEKGSSICMFFELIMDMKQNLSETSCCKNIIFPRSTAEDFQKEGA